MKTFNLNTKTGVPITLDGSKEPAFYIDANDMQFMERALELYKTTNDFEKEMHKKAESLDIEVDENNVPKDASKIVSLMKEQFTEVFEKIDFLLGDEVSKKVFKGRMNYQLLSDFMDLITNVIEETRTSSTEKYKLNRQQRRDKKNVMA